MRESWKRAKRQVASDAGAALAIVLVIVVFLSLWLAAAAVFNQSATIAVSTTITESNRRAALVSGALAYSLNQLTYDELGEASRRWGVNDNRGTQSCAVKTETGNILPYKTTLDVNGVPTNFEVIVKCTESAESGISYPLASYVLVGMNENCKSTSTTARGTCVVGQDAGLNIVAASSNDCAALESSRLSIQGGLVNSSGVWQAVGCGNIKLQQTKDPTSDKINEPSITQPKAADCQFTSFDYPSGDSGKVSLCVCPEVSFEVLGATSVVPDSTKCINPDTAINLSPTDDSSELKSYLDSVSVGLGIPDSIASSTAVSTASVADACATGSIGNTQAILWTDGFLGSEQIALMNVQQKICSSPIVLQPGVYRLVPDAKYLNGTNCPTTRVAGSSSTGGGKLTITYECANTLEVTGLIIGGSPLGIPERTAGTVMPDGPSAVTCDRNADGIELQFANASFLKVDKGRMIVCPRKNTTNPAISAPLSTSPADFSRAITTDPFLEIVQTNAVNNDYTAAGKCVYCLISYGLVYAPAGWANLSLNGVSVDYRFDQGAIFRAMKLGMNGNVRAGGSVKPPPPFNGDRVVQLRFYVKSDTLTQRDLGTAQVIIKDYYGRRPASGYRILAWRTYW